MHAFVHTIHVLGVCMDTCTLNHYGERRRFLKHIENSLFQFTFQSLICVDLCACSYL